MWTSIYVDLSPEDAVRRLADLGWPAMELSTEHLETLRNAGSPARLRAFRALVDDLGLQLNQAHITIHVDIAATDGERRRADCEIVREDISVLSELQIRQGVLHPGGCDRHATLAAAHEQVQVREEALADLAQYAQAAGVRLALENGGGCTLGPNDEMLWDASVAGLRELITRLGSPALGICLDTGHAILEQWENAEAVRVAGDLLIALHIADNDGSGDQHRIPYSYGSPVDWPSVVSALRAIGYDGQFNLEVPGERGRPLEILDALVRYALDVTCRLLSGEVGPPTRL